MRITFWLLVLGGVAMAGAASAAEGDCIASAVTVCALDEGSTLYNVNGVYRSDKWNTLASVAGAMGSSSASARVGQVDHYDSLYYCQWTCTRAWNQRDATELNVTQNGPTTSGRVWVGQEEGFNYYNSGSTTRFWEYKTTGAAVSRSVGDRSVEAGAGQTSWRGYTSTTPYATGCSTGAFARVDGRDAAALPGAPCDVAGQDTRVPQLYKHCAASAAGQVCGRFPDWPDGTGLPFL